MGNYVSKTPHASSYWQEVERAMQFVSAGEQPDPNSPLNPQGHTGKEVAKPGGLNKPQLAEDQPAGTKP